MKVLAVVAAVGVWTVGLAAAQQPSARSAPDVVVSGIVLSSITSQPLPGVHVSLRTPAMVPAPTAVTDELGHFELAGEGTIRRPQVVARKAGHASTSVAVVPETPVTIRLTPRGAATGRVLDDAGEAIVGARVSLSRPRGGTVESTRTDDRGEYRLSVDPGQPLFLAVTTTGTGSRDGSAIRPTSGQPDTLTTYFPGTSVRGDAVALQLEPGEERRVDDFVIATERSARQPGAALDLFPGATFEAEGVADDADGVLTGRVIDVTGMPMANAQVVFTSERPGSPRRFTRTDVAGQFEFTQVPRGAAHVAASKPGFSLADTRPTVASAARAIPPVTLVLTPWAAVSGRVLDEFGEPVQGVLVRAMRMQLVGARRQLVASGVEATTNDHGEYRLWGLRPAIYSIAAVADGRPDLLGYRLSYVSTASGTAEPAQLRLRAGEELAMAEVLLARAATFRVSGQVLRASGQPGSVGTVRLLPSQRTGSGVDAPLSASLAPNGRFEFRNVPDGDYSIQVYRGRLDTSTEGEFGALEVAVRGADVPGLVVRASAGSTIAGSIVLDDVDSPRRPARADIELSPVPADPDLAPASNWASAGVTVDWQFLIQGINGPRRLVATRLPRNWTVKAVRSNGIEITDQPLALGSSSASMLDVEVVLTDKPTRIEGSVTSAGGIPRMGATVVAFSPERTNWYGGSRHVRTARTARNGGFELTGLPPGDYFIAVLPAAEVDTPDAWLDPDVLEGLLSESSFVSLGDGTRVSVALRQR